MCHFAVYRRECIDMSLARCVLYTASHIHFLYNVFGSVPVCNKLSTIDYRNRGRITIRLLKRVFQYLVNWEKTGASVCNDKWEQRCKNGGESG